VQHRFFDLTYQESLNSKAIIFRRKKKAPKEVICFETLPAEQAHLDWKE
jgi:hypothetical protein